MQWLCDDHGHGKAIEGTYPAIYSSEVKIFHLFCTKFVSKLSQIICILLTVPKIYRLPHFPEILKFVRVYRVLGRVSYFEIFESLGSKILQRTQICVPCKILQGVRP